MADLDLTVDHVSIVAAIANSVTPILHYLPQGIPFFTDHGLLHSTNVLRYIRDLVKEYPIKFNEEEKYILVLASYLHDIGCISKREDHNITTLKVLAKDHFNFIRAMIGPTFYKSLECVIVAHSSTFDFNELPDDPDPDIRLKLICPIFRLSDGCDISSNRIKSLLLEVLVEEELIDEETEGIWKAHLAIQNIKVDGTKLTVQVFDSKEAAFCLDHFKEELTTINKFLTENEFNNFTVEVEEVIKSILEELEVEE